mgnify:CR=1 FL=1|tara:strand:+ start:280 stop:558 length:279 start_codon:yes stop_codon:yes gene_type:complete
MIELGGNIVLSGFKELEPAQLIVVKKMVGSYVKKISDTYDFIKLSLNLKKLHNKQVELHGKIDFKDNFRVAEVDDHNLFFALNKVLGKLEPK